MTLDQFHALKTWHTTHGDHPFEKNLWEFVLTLWLSGWVGLAATTLLAIPAAQLLCLALLFLPRAYVGFRTWLHRAGRLRCDWIVALG
ncbi:MAG: hypothetical protein E6H58_16655 [Betaproteobacteria bacterium]|jgi:hypothetical protein|nr:MAG: hypothetical protein E6H65_05555 [Betaproteobacteria bacterium]TMH29124.1 MAG: hypothetical protein E6H58_16655 [Betaproteobacteria bacterium]